MADVAPGYPCMRVFVPPYKGYYHFMVESVMGLFRLLTEHGLLDSKECQIWYSGNYPAIVQLFSCWPLQPAASPLDLPPDVIGLNHLRPNVDEDWVALHPLKEYLLRVFPASGTYDPGITLIRRVGKREYAEHDLLLPKLERFGLPVREAILERLSLGEQIDLMRNTRLLIGPHGAGETNMMFMPAAGKIVELYPKGFSDRAFSTMARADGHQLVEIESSKPGVIGREPSPRVRAFLETRGWPTRRQYFGWKPDRMELGRVLRDVASFSIDPRIVLDQVARMLEN